MSNYIARMGSIFLLMGSASAFGAEPSKAPRPEIFQKLIDCRSVTDTAARLACYDSQVAKIDEAESRADVVVIDRAQVKQAKRSLFGLSLPSLGLFGGGDDGSKGEEEDAQLESKVKSADQVGGGDWVIILEDGAKWVQTETKSILDPKPGHPVRIRKAAMGSFMVNINGRTAIRMRRQN